MSDRRGPALRRLRFESLEDRRMLAVAAAPPLPAPLTMSQGRVSWHSYTAYDDDGTGNRPLDGAIHVYDFAAAAPYRRAEQTIAANVTHAMNPNFSGDGRYLTFMGLPATRAYSQSDDSWANFLDVFVYDFVQDDVTNVSAAIGRSGFGQVDEDPTFSPDGASIAFKYQRTDIWAVTLADNSLRRVTARAGEESGPQYSPDGAWIMFWVGSGPSAYIAKAPADGVAVTTYAIVIDNDPVEFPGDAGVQDYFASYWGDSKVIYTSWNSPRLPGSGDDDDIRVLDLATGSNEFAAFNSPAPVDDSDGFAIDDSLLGFSKRLAGHWDLWYGDPTTGVAASLGIGKAGKHNLGGKFATAVVTHPDDVAVRAGDFDGNGQVDGADFLKWQRALGSADAAVDSNGNGTVDSADLGAWITGFGSVPTGADAASSALSDVVPSQTRENSAGPLNRFDAIFAAGDFTILFQQSRERRTARPLRGR